MKKLTDPRSVTNISMHRRFIRSDTHVFSNTEAAYCVQIRTFSASSKRRIVLKMKDRITGNEVPSKIPDVLCAGWKHLLEEQCGNLSLL